MSRTAESSQVDHTAAMVDYRPSLSQRPAESFRIYVGGVRADGAIKGSKWELAIRMAVRPKSARRLPFWPPTSVCLD